MYTCTYFVDAARLVGREDHLTTHEDGHALTQPQYVGFRRVPYQVCLSLLPLAFLESLLERGTAL
jgi:hypothetical protein